MKITIVIQDDKNVISEKDIQNIKPYVKAISENFKSNGNKYEIELSDSFPKLAKKFWKKHVSISIKLSLSNMYIKFKNFIRKK